MSGPSMILSATQSASPFRTIVGRCLKLRGGSELGGQPSTESLKGLALRRPDELKWTFCAQGQYSRTPKARCFAPQNIQEKFHECPVFGQFTLKVNGRTGNGR